jgi:hypothetical protein
MTSPRRPTLSLPRPPLFVPTTIRRDRFRKISAPAPSADVRVNERDLAEALRIAEAVFPAGGPSTPEAGR